MKTLVHYRKKSILNSKLLFVFLILMALSIQETYAQPYKADLPSGSMGLRLKATQGGGNSPYILFDSRNADTNANAVFLQRQEGNSLVFRRYNQTNPLADQRLLMRMNSNGNIGIFTNPLERFHVNGNIRTDRNFIVRGRSGDTNRQALFGTDGAGNHRIELRSGATPYIDFSNNAGSTLEDFDARIVLEKDNAIAIQGAGLSIAGGYLPNGYELAVEGRAIATGMKIQSFDNWPDYVFETDYNLRSLTELEDFIQANKHLPNVPSAAKVAQEEGFDIATLNKALLEKVEELTLYTIAQEKQLTKQQAQLDALIEKVNSMASKQ